MCVVLGCTVLTGAQNGGAVGIVHRGRYPATINTAREARVCGAAAQDVVGADGLRTGPEISTLQDLAACRGLLRQCAGSALPLAWPWCNDLPLHCLSLMLASCMIVYRRCHSHFSDNGW